MESIPHILLLSLFPAFMIVFGCSVAILKRPSAQFSSIAQTFAAGIVISAAVIEILPLVVDAHERVTTYVGFASGVLLLMAIKALLPQESAYGHLYQEEEQHRLMLSKAPRAGLALSMFVDMLIYGLLLGVVFVVSERSGTLLAIGISFQLFFLGLVMSVTLHPGYTKIKLFFLSLFYFLSILGAAALGAYLASILSGAMLIGLLAFAVAAILNLVIQALFYEANKKTSPSLDTAVFFLGFFIVLILEEWH